MFWLQIIMCLIFPMGLATIVTKIIDFWYSHPVKEEKSTPFYITKKLDF